MAVHNGGEVRIQRPPAGSERKRDLGARSRCLVSGVSRRRKLANRTASEFRSVERTSR